MASMSLLVLLIGIANAINADNSPSGYVPGLLNQYPRIPGVKFPPMMYFSPQNQYQPPRYSPYYLPQQSEQYQPLLSPSFTTSAPFVPNSYPPCQALPYQYGPCQPSPLVYPPGQVSPKISYFNPYGRPGVYPSPLLDQSSPFLPVQSRID